MTTAEEDLIKEVLFNDNLNKLRIFEKIDYDKLINIMGMHLIIPSFYYNISKKKITKKFPADFVKYLKEIFSINRNRNKILLNEIKFISQNLEKALIDHVFVKGSANLVFDIYDDIGERMVGDIDILVDDKFEIKTQFLLQKLNYKLSNKNYFFKNFRHLPRLYNVKTGFAVEIHKRPFEKESIVPLTKNKILKDKIICKKVCIPSSIHQIEYNIYNSQINNNNHYNLNYSFRNLYDSYLLLKFNNYKFKNKNNIINRYIKISQELNLDFFGQKNIRSDYYLATFFKMKKNSFWFFKLFNFIHYQIYNLDKRPKQMKMIFNNKNYRRYLLEKFKL